MDNDTKRMVRCAVCGEFHFPEECVELAEGTFVCTSCWLEARKDLVVCKRCGAVVNKMCAYWVHLNDHGDQGYVCPDCERDDFSLCVDCGERWPNDLVHETVGGDYVCDSCIGRHDWVECNDCNKYLLLSDATSINGGDYYVCAECRDAGDYHQCEDCCEWFHENDMHDVGGDCEFRWVCDSCDEHYAYCNRCDRTVHDDNYDFDRDMCLSCCEEEDEEEENDRGRVYNYHWGREHGWYRTPFILKDEPRRDTLTYGVEIEMSDGRFDPDRMGDGEKMYHFEHDGSLSAGGVEMITQPCSLLYHKTKFPWEGALRGAIDCGFLSHRCKSCSCGFHVHIGRSALTDLDEFKLDVFFNRYARFWEHIARRNSSQWATMFPGKTLADCVVDARRHYGSHGVAVNHSNCATVEIRIAKGTLRKETVLGTLEAYDATIHYLRGVGAYDLYNNIDVVWDGFVKFVAARPKMYEDAIRMMARLGNYRVSKERVAQLDAKRIKKDNWNNKKEGK